MNKVEYREEFYSPFNGMVLFKAEEEKGQWVVYLQASNEGLDQEQEKIMSKALNDAKDYYLNHGVLSWDHKHKMLHDPQYIVGEPLDVAFTDTNETLVKGWLYQKNEIAQRLWNNIQSGAKKLGASVGGGILQKSGEGVIERVIWDETAITHKPVNDMTLGHVQLIPFEAFAKALMAGAGVNAANFTGGRALTPESVDDKLVDQTFGQTDVPNVPYAESRRYFDGLLSKMVKGQVTSMNDVVSFTLDQGYNDSVAASLIDFVSTKVKRLRR